MKLEKATKRDKNRKNRDKMIVTGKSVFVIEETLIKRAKKIKNKKGK